MKLRAICSVMARITVSSGTSSPLAISALQASPSAVPASMAARSMSPVESWTMPRLATRRAA